MTQKNEQMVTIQNKTENKNDPWLMSIQLFVVTSFNVVRREANEPVCLCLSLAF